MGEGATCAWARRTAARPSCGDKPGANRSTEVSLAPKGCAAPSAAPWAADAEACSRAPPAKGCGSYGDKPGGHAQLRGPCTHTDTHTHARKHARARRHAHTQIHTRTCTHTHARTLARAQKHTHTHRHTGTHRQTHTRALTNQALGERGPQESPSCATAEKGNWVYRICRMRENPWKLRSPPEHLRDLTRPQLRAMILAAVACGNDPQMTSAFLHASTSLVAMRRLMGERRWLYSHWLCRWRQDCVGDDYINFGD